MPGWLKGPFFSSKSLNYVVDALRTSMLGRPAQAPSSLESRTTAVIVLTHGPALVFIAFALISASCNGRPAQFGGFWSSMHVLELHGTRAGAASAGFLNAHPVPPMLEAVESTDNTTASCIESAKLAHNSGPPMDVIAQGAAAARIRLAASQCEAARRPGARPMWVIRIGRKSANLHASTDGSRRSSCPRSLGGPERSRSSLMRSS